MATLSSLLGGNFTGQSGYSGISGYSGYSGISGYSGLVGQSGYSGSIGQSGYSGISGYSGSGVAGANTSVQYNNNNSPAGADNVTIQGGDLVLAVNDNPASPSANSVKLFCRNAGNRMMPAFEGPSGLDSVLQASFARNKIAMLSPAGNSTSITSFGLDVTAVGTPTAINVATTNLATSTKRLEYAVTTASTSAVAGFYGSVNQYHTGNPANIYGGFFFVCRFGPSRGSASNATRRFFCGFSSLTTAPTDVNPSTTQTNALGVGTDSTDTNWQFIHRTTTGTAVKFDTGFAKAATDNTKLYELVIFTSPFTSDVNFQFTDLTNGSTVRYTATSSIPGQTTLLSPRCWTSVGGTSSVVGISLNTLYIETDN
jgi:hypothetical protein